MGKSCGKFFQENLAGNSCMEIFAGNSCGKILQYNLVANSCCKFMWENLAGILVGNC